MSSNSYYFRRRTIGRAASPPTWACYEQIPYDHEYTDDDDDDDGDEHSGASSDSCSEDDEDYPHHPLSETHPESDGAHPPRDESDDIDMDLDEAGAGGQPEGAKESPQKDVKGKQRAVEPEQAQPPAQPQQQRRHHHRQAKKQRQQPVYTLRPILTIQRSQGFVWNQDLFVPPYIKDRYVASTSPPNARGFISTSASSTNSTLTDYEVEVVEIRVREGELQDIIP